MQWELSELNLQTVILLQFLDTPGDEVKSEKTSRTSGSGMIVSFLSQLFDSTYLRAWKSKVRDWIRSISS